MTSAPTTTLATTTTTLATTTTVVDPHLLLGTWLDPRALVLITFEEDGNHYVGYQAGKPFEFGPFTLDGNRLTMTSEEGPDPVCVGLGPGVFDIELSADGNEIRGTLVSDLCLERANGGSTA